MLIIAPLAALYLVPERGGQGLAKDEGRAVAALMPRSVLGSAGVALAAIVLGWLPGRWLGTAAGRGQPGGGGSRGHGLMFAALLFALVLPPYLLYYAWWLPVSPTSWLGGLLVRQGTPGQGRMLSEAVAWVVMVLWFWPLAAVLLSQAWRSSDRQLWDSAALDATAVQRFWRITVPLLAGPAALAFAVCGLLALSENGPLHLAGARTVATELAVVYELTGSAGTVARAAWPIVLAALVAGILLGWRVRDWAALSYDAPLAPAGRPGRSARLVAVLLLAITIGCPVGLLLANWGRSPAALAGFSLVEYWRLHGDELAWSGLIAAAASGLAMLIGAGPVVLEATVSRHHRHRWGTRRVSRFLASAMRATILAAMLLPGSLIAVGLVSVQKLLILLDAFVAAHGPAALGGPGAAGQPGQPGSAGPPAWADAWWWVSLAHSVRFAAVPMILLTIARRGQERDGGQLSEMAAVDGASPLATWRFVHLPRIWPLIVAAFLLVAMLSVTELGATMVMLPPGLPNFAQRLLNQMHYARDQQVIGSCLLLVGVFVVLAAAVAALVLKPSAKCRVANANAKCQVPSAK